MIQKRFGFFKTRRYIPLITRINLLFAVLILLICGILSVFTYRLKLQSHLSDRASQNAVLLRTIAQNINVQLAQVEIIAQEAAYDSETIQLLSNESQPKQILSILFSVGRKLHQNESYLTALGMDMVLLSENDTMVESYDTLIHESRLNSNAFYQDFLNSTALCGWGDAEVNFLSTAGETVLPYYHKVLVVMHNRIGAVRCTVRTEKLFSTFTQSDDGTMMVIRNGQILFGGEGQTVPVIGKTSGSWRSGDKLYFAVPISDLDATLVMCEAYASLRAVAIQDVKLSMLMIFSLGIVLLVVTRKVLRAMLSRLHRLTEAVGNIPEDCKTPALPEAGPDEVGQLSRAFNKLLEQISTYYDALIQKEKDKRHAQSMALQYQINPHFLFNSLYWLQLQMEEAGVDPALTASIEQLGQVLHYNMLTSHTALLSEEEEQILAYVGFMSATKGNHIHVSLHMPKELRSARILRLTLQPLLENAISHGYISGRALNIQIEFNVNEAADILVIAVHNDGKRIPPEQLAALQERVDMAALDGMPTSVQQSGHGTALNNLSRRLALTYQAKARLLVESDENDTCIRILLPLRQCLRGESQ